ncbi:Monooxygenase af470 [Paramyrothecium foliicola]|nr:Monooxygenase af470 [Paramyrothecium foliicola]
MAKEFTRKFLPSDEPQEFPSGNIMLFLIRDTFRLHTLLAFGAVAQILLCAIFPLKWAIVPAAGLLLNSAVTTIIQIKSPQSHIFRDGVVEGRTTSQIPSDKGTFGPEPSAGSVVVFQLGIQYNHPMGVFGPGRKEIAGSFLKMNNDLMRRREELGLLSMSRWRGNERETNNTLLLTYYFKDVHSLNRFAHEELHRKAWDMYLSSTYKKHIGVFHETYVISAKHYESLYANCRPVLLARGMARCEMESGKKWVNTLVSANSSALKTHYSRLGRDANGDVKT